MKSKTATIWIIGVIFVLTVLLTFIQPSVIHQLVVWVSGAFAVLVALALFVVGNWPEAAQQPTKDAWKTAAPECREDQAVIAAVKALRQYHMDDAQVAAITGFDIDVIKAVPR